jgi:hypothetical protein
MKYMRIRNRDTADYGPDSPDDSRPSGKKRKGADKKVVSVLIGDVDGSKSKGETYPPSDSWAWRKYGQKPIKGSPYPRGYYRCSSSKGCPARKQVERNRVDPTMLVITYASEHNHPIPTTTKQHRHSVSAAVKPSPKIEEEEEEEDDVEVSGDGQVSGDGEEEEEEVKEEILVPQTKQEGDLLDVLTWQGNIELYDGYEFGWYADVAAVTSSVLEDTTTTMSSSCCSTATDADVETTFKMREEDELLFADLGELPECSMVFQRNGVVPESAVSCTGG